RQAEGGEACRVAVRVDDDAGALGTDAGKRAFEDALAADANEAFVAAAHAPRETSREHEPVGRRLSRHGQRPCAGAWPTPPRRSAGPDRTRSAARPRAR